MAEYNREQQKKDTDHKASILLGFHRNICSTFGRIVFIGISLADDYLVK